MGYKSIDALQNDLASEVFHYAKDRKKAAGRALGTIVEVVTYYALCSWALRDHVVIERKLPEFANPEVVHNVEFSLHAIAAMESLKIAPWSLPLTPAKIRRQMSWLNDHSLKSSQVISRDGRKRNSAVLAETDAGPIVAHVDDISDMACSVSIVSLLAAPFAFVECKRVGVEEGMKKGPQTIEKAKQGAYVARTVSSLQKIRSRSGETKGVIESARGTFRVGAYDDMLRKAIRAPSRSDYPGVVLTVGVVSNHGNWFTSENYNKELRVLAQSYDWLLFLTDDGLYEFIDKLLLYPVAALEPARKAFLESYSGKKGKNRFTKVNMDIGADAVLRDYFESHQPEVDGWFNVIAPTARLINDLKSDLHTLARKVS